MNIECAEQLVRIYNTLRLVKTSGEDTVLMGKCLESFQNLLPQLQVISEDQQIKGE